MLLFGITGGIGSGKTAVCNSFREKGITVIQADPLAKELTNTLPEIREALTREFGEDLYRPSGPLDKDKLSKIVFLDATKRKRVNQIIHPHVLDWITQETKRLKAGGSQLVGVEAALIFESGMDKTLDLVVVVDAPLDVRIQRLEARDNLSKDAIRARINSQMPVEEKIKQADYVIENKGSLKALALQVEDLYRWLTSKASALS